MVMKYSEAERGRVFVLRLEDGEVLHESIEKFAVDNDISAASVIAVGGADKGSVLITGPEEGRASPVKPVLSVLDDVHELSGTGTIFPDSTGNPVLHMHAACGRKESSVTGCVRSGVKVWHVMEVIIQEITNTSAARLPDPGTGFELLQP